MHASPEKTALLIGASRGLWFAMAEEYLKRCWHVIATARPTSAHNLLRLCDAAQESLEIEIVDVSTEEFVRVMVTNALSPMGPMRAIETLQDLVPADGTIGVMSSGQGSITNNTNGGYEVYRGSKAALNTFMRGFAARHADDPRTLLLMAPWWVRTDWGGPSARLSVEEGIPNLLNTMEAHSRRAGLHYVDYLGKVVPW